jgi:DNA-binding MarR family transcriptional regulator
VSVTPSTRRAPPRTHGADDDLVDALAQLSYLVQGLLARHASAHDLSMVQTRLLGVLRDREPTMRELAVLLELDKSSVTGLIDRAELRGLVQRTRSVEDRREVRARLTARGRRVVSKVEAGFQREISAVTRALSSGDRQRLSSIATSVVAYSAK